MKPRRNPKLLGDQAECAFLAQCLQRGLIASKPVWGQQAYDFVIDVGKANHRGHRGGGGRLWRVQVKSVGTMRQRWYAVSTHGSRNRVYGPDEFDFFAAWVAPLNFWYVIPLRAVLPARSAWLFPHVEGSWGRYEKFREAWHLLTR